MDSSSGKSVWSRLEICSGDQPLTPFTVTAMRFVSPYERSLPGASNVAAISVANLALQTVSNIVVQPWISYQLSTAIQN